MSETHVTWAPSVPILVFLGLSVLDLRPMYATDRHTDRRQTASSLSVIIMPRPLGAGHNNNQSINQSVYWHQATLICSGLVRYDLVFI